MSSDPRIIVALDYPDAKGALDLSSRLDPTLCRLKVGKELFTAAGPSLLEKLQQQGFSVFLDLKYHDIPNTVAAACQAAAGLGIWMINVHALGGRAMMLASREALAKAGRRPPKLIAVTVLTSIGTADMTEIGLGGSPQEAAARLARLAQECGLDGVVCSAEEAPRLRAATAPGFLLVTPGIRLESDARGDQSRVVTPVEAVRRGADYLVIGRPVTQSRDPAATLAAIRQSLKEGMAA